ncbi:glycine cleavage system protein GcvH [Elusimicrobiota bacterium]
MELFYTKNHEWIGVDGDSSLIGITEYAVSQLGDITFIELPAAETTVNRGDILCTVESVKAASDIYVPVSGTIKEVNTALENAPETINSSPESEGWICKIKPTNADNTEDLLNSEQYADHLKTLE